MQGNNLNTPYKLAAVEDDWSHWEPFPMEVPGTWGSTGDVRLKHRWLPRIPNVEEKLQMTHANVTEGSMFHQAVLAYVA